MSDAIQTNCARCAYKHLTAAYACLPYCDSRMGTEWYGPMQKESYVARAVIALIEAANGYPAHMALASGCLAMAEIREPKTAVFYRVYRQRIDTATNLVVALSIAHDLQLICDDYYMLQAHLCEAVRELPSLRTMLPAVNHSMTNAAWGEWFADTIVWLVDTYEMGFSIDYEDKETHASKPE
jgi:hypothetical protein